MEEKDSKDTKKTCGFGQDFCFCKVIFAILIILFVWVWTPAWANIAITVLAVLILLGAGGCCCKKMCKKK
jgi:hypothetical protein